MLDIPDKAGVASLGAKEEEDDDEVCDWIGNADDEENDGAVNVGGDRAEGGSELRSGMAVQEASNVQSRTLFQTRASGGCAVQLRKELVMSVQAGRCCSCSRAVLVVVVVARSSLPRSGARPELGQRQQILVIEAISFLVLCTS